MRRLSIAAVAVLVALLGFGWLALSGSPTAPVGEVAPARVISAGRPRPTAPGVAPPADDDASTASAEEHAAHAAMAEALGFVALRCWAGPEYDSDAIVSELSARIADGWYLALERELEGRRFVVREFDRVDVPPDAPEWERKEPEQLFEVSWSASASGEAVECQVHPLRRLDLRVTVADEAGEPVAGARVGSCGTLGQTDARGLVLLEDAVTGPSCLVAADLRDDERVCVGQIPAPEVGAERVVSVALPVECADAADSEAAFALLDAHGPETMSTAEALATLRGQLDALRPLTARDFGEEGDRALRALITRQEEWLAHVEEVEAQQARQEQVQEQVEALRQRLDAASTPEERQAIAREILELKGARPVPR